MKKIYLRMIIFIFVSIGFQNIYPLAGKTSSFRLPVFSRVGSIAINEQKIRQFFASKKGGLILLGILSVLLGPRYYRDHRAKKPRGLKRPDLRRLGIGSDQAFKESAEYAIKKMLLDGIKIQEFTSEEIEQKQEIEYLGSPNPVIANCGRVEKKIIDGLQKNNFEFAEVGIIKQYTKRDLEKIKPLILEFYQERMPFVSWIYRMDTCYIPLTNGSGFTEYTISPKIGWTLGVIKKEDGTGYHGLNILGLLRELYTGCWDYCRPILD